MSKRKRRSKVLLLLDADHVMYIVCPNKKLYNQDGSPKLDSEGNHVTENKTKEECISMADNYIKNVIKATKADYYIGALTVKKCFRYDINPDYKANRKNLEKPPHFDAVKEHLITKWKFEWFEGLEADDIILSARNHYRGDYRTIIATTDKDLLTLEGVHYDPKKLQWVTSTKQGEEKFFWSSMMVGDKADGIIGIPGIGPVKAVVYLEKKGKKHAPSAVLSKYITYFGEIKGIEEFYKNYKCLKMVDDTKEKFPSFIMPLPINVKYE